MNHLLEILKKDNDAASQHSGDGGSNTDSGRGPSEEGGDAKKSIQQNTGRSSGLVVGVGAQPLSLYTNTFADPQLNNRKYV